MDDPKVILNFGVFILFYNLNQVKILLEEGEPAALSEVVFFGDETSKMGTMVLSSYQLLTCTEFTYMITK